jgi:hypothetical protein
VKHSLTLSGRKQIPTIYGRIITNELGLQLLMVLEQLIPDQTQMPLSWLAPHGRNRAPSGIFSRAVQWMTQDLTC